MRFKEKRRPTHRNLIQEPRSGKHADPQNHFAKNESEKQKTHALIG